MERYKKLEESKNWKKDFDEVFPKAEKLIKKVLKDVFEGRYVASDLPKKKDAEAYINKLLSKYIKTALDEWKGMK